ncbi:MAG: biotin transporter BioY [bacterium]|nr:biotin transporter BioY [bacterium]
MNKSIKSTRELTKMALLAALLCVSAYITIPIGEAPLTLQTLLINLIAIILTPTEGFLTVLVYVIIGAVGIPVFSGGQGGLGKLFGPTGGYIFAFLAAAPAMAFSKKYFAAACGKFIKNKTTAEIVGYTVNAVIIGMVIVYAVGTVYMKLMLGRGWGEVLMMAVVPFIPLDIVKCAAAAVIGVPLRKSLNRMK